MAKITLDNIRHSYLPNPQNENDWALKNMHMTWEDGSAYALLGSSGCGKTTLLNIISGLLTPSDGNILFDDKAVTKLPPDHRNIAQVFQFPVVYDTMTVYDNLAFPLRNRGLAPDQVDKRVQEVATMLELTHTLKQRADGLTADGKQKISLGRGLVRSDVNAIMFDEPLTVIDPHLKWQLRSKLKELHQRIGATMIYVTHDQTEALTFADKVVVMHDGTVVQMGTPVELFEKPQHTFVGHFIGSPGMNVLPAKVSDGKLIFEGQVIETEIDRYPDIVGETIELGIRPEFVKFASSGLPVKVISISDVGRYKIVDVEHENISIKLVVDEDHDIPGGSVFVQFDKKQTHLYVDSWLYSGGDE